ncbi:MAG: molecular chaperone DnaK [Tissierellia bacterium]|nr:molecular chaperone DnaK [Tissierellia bacterium]
MIKDENDINLQLLLDEKDRVEHLIRDMGDDTRNGSMDKYYTELSAYDNHPADIGTEMFMMEHDKGLCNRLRDVLYEIETSIEEVKSGKYGLCSVCNEKISRERLRLIPYTKLCIGCSNKRATSDEGMERGSRREDTVNPFYRNYRAGDQFDREDSYQEVARFNRVADDPSFGTGDDIGVLDEEGSGAVEEIERVSQDYFNRINR